MAEFTKRVLSGLGFVVIMIGSILLGRHTFFALFLLIISLGLYEFFSILKLKYYQPQVVSGSIIAILLFLFCYLNAAGIIPLSSVALLIPIMLLIFIFELFKKTKTPFQNISLTFLGLIYIVVPLSMVNYLVLEPGISTVNYKPDILLGVLVLIWVYDSFAYIFGVTLGKHKLFPRITPKKSWEGLIGGLISTVGFSILLSMVFDGLGMVHWIVISILVVIFGTFGDLIESLFKRSVGIKDSGKIMPGHGGLLDRFDSFLFSIPIVFAYLVFFELI